MGKYLFFWYPTIHKPAQIDLLSGRNGAVLQLSFYDAFSHMPVTGFILKGKEKAPPFEGSQGRRHWKKATFVLSHEISFSSCADLGAELSLMPTWACPHVSSETGTAGSSWRPRNPGRTSKDITKAQQVDSLHKSGTNLEPMDSLSTNMCWIHLGYKSRLPAIRPIVTQFMGTQKQCHCYAIAHQHQALYINGVQIQHLRASEMRHRTSWARTPTGG